MDGNVQAVAAQNASERKMFGAQVVSKTLEYMNRNVHSDFSPGSMEQSYDFNQKVLGAYLTGKGTIADTMI